MVAGLVRKRSLEGNRWPSEQPHMGARNSVNHTNPRAREFVARNRATGRPRIAWNRTWIRHEGKTPYRFVPRRLFRWREDYQYICPDTFSRSTTHLPIPARLANNHLFPKPLRSRTPHRQVLSQPPTLKPGKDKPEMLLLPVRKVPRSHQILMPISALQCTRMTTF